MRFLLAAGMELERVGSASVLFVFASATLCYGETTAAAQNISPPSVRQFHITGPNKRKKEEPTSQEHNGTRHPTVVPTISCCV